MKSTVDTLHSSRHPVCSNWAEMGIIRKPAHNLVRWARPQDAAITRFLQALTQHNSDQLRGTWPATDLADRLADHLAPYAKSFEEGFERLCADVGDLATSFADLASSPTLKATFAIIPNGMCRLFHTDAIELRLLCTYLGPGTLWVPDQFVNWDRMEEPSNEARVLDMDQVQQFAPFEVGILKGAMYEANAGPAVLHRSPSVSEKKDVRVLLRLDSQLTW